MESVMGDSLVMDDEPEFNEFYFESDHLALRNNKDYLGLLKTVVTLEALRVKSLEDLDKLIGWRQKALKDPVSFASQLQSGCQLDLPGSRQIPDLPKIDFSKYHVYGSDTRMGPQTRPKEQQLDPKQQQKQNEKGKILVRGRPFDDSKPETFNQPWTDEEQMRLIDLLQKYPEETVQMRRWTKIANEFGNRTPKQVSSRVQKYEKKLKQEERLGRGTRTSLTNNSRNHKKRRRRINRVSTFFPYKDFDCIENRDDDMEIDGNEDNNDVNVDGGINNNSCDFYDDSNSSVPSEHQNQQAYSHIDMLKRIKFEKNDDSTFSFRHFGFKCAVCKQEPIQGTRWHCTECTNNSIDFCADCAVAQLDYSDIHSSSHNLTAIDKTNSCNNYDLEYFPQSFASSSYLDCNFSTE